MFSADQYELLDFGEGRRLERFGPLTLDRPCPSADRVARGNPARWQSVDARFDRRTEHSGAWTAAGELPERWTVRHDRLRLELKRTDYGHVGLFAEQAEHWSWIAAQVASAASQGPPLRVLNLFAYTGGSTLAAAAAGAEVTHVDGAKNILAWARANAALSGLAEAPIRWIGEDVLKFCKRELKRGSLYDAVILDPPSYGHGPRGEVWRLSKHLAKLLEVCAELTAGRRQFMLLTCHTPGYDAPRLKRMAAEAWGDAPLGAIDAREMNLRSAAGRELPCGVCVRWQKANRGLVDPALATL
jgi:23S rRNA (cytosine1962-C5)-methyltransferase